MKLFEILISFFSSVKLSMRFQVIVWAFFSIAPLGRICEPKTSSTIAGLKNCMKRGYSYIEGVEELLCGLKENGYEIHAFTNYPIWYQMIEDKLKLSTYLSWTFCSCIFGKRKPDAEFYKEVLKHLNVEPANCIFIDDRMRNVEAGIEAGFRGFQFKGVDSLRNDLSTLGIVISTDAHSKNQDLSESVE